MDNFPPSGKGRRKEREREREREREGEVEVEGVRACRSVQTVCVHMTGEGT